MLAGVVVDPIPGVGRLRRGVGRGAVEVRRAPLEPLQRLLGRRSRVSEPLAEVFPRWIEDGRDDGGHVRVLILGEWILASGSGHHGDLGALLLHRGGERAVELVDLFLKLGPDGFERVARGRRRVGRLCVGGREHSALLRDERNREVLGSLHQRLEGSLGGCYRFLHRRFAGDFAAARQLISK